MELPIKIKSRDMRVEELGLELGKGEVVKVGYEFLLSTGYWDEHTRDKFGKQLTFKSSSGYWCEITRDEFGNQLTFKSSYTNTDK